MQDVPKIVTDRLRAASSVVNHPDADVLTAFSEQALSSRQRTVVLEHLARCGDCREVVALALPDAQTVDRIVHPAHRRWLTWPVLRWGFVGVGVVAIASFGFVQYWRVARRASSMADFAQLEPVKKQAQNVPPANPALPEMASNVKAPAAMPSAETGNKTKPQIEAREFDRLDQSTQLQKAETRDGYINEKKSLGAVVGGPVNGLAQLQHGPKVQYQSNFQNNSQNNVAGGQAPAAPLPYPKQPPNGFMPADVGAPTASLTAAQSPVTQVDVQGKNQETLVLENNMPLKPIEGGQGQTVERAKDADGVAFSRSAKVPSGGMSSASATSAFAMAPPNASWTIIAGGLQRSFDQGKTWQDVNVNAVPAAGMDYAYTPQKAAGKAAADKSGVAGKPAANPPVFRAVVANRADVWAGGSNGLLYHSVDSGAHWVRVLPFSGITVLTGDVVSLDFPDALHGKIVTSTQEVWLTSDGGQTWQKQ